MVERLTTRAAAARLGVSTATIRRMIQAGELRAEREVRPQGTRWIVLFDTARDASQQASGRAHGTSLEPDALRVALETIADLRRRLDAAESAQAELRQLLAGAMRQLPAGTTVPTPAEPAEPPETPVTPVKPRGWLDRLLRR